jgi:hypothetical protein
MTVRFDFKELVDVNTLAYHRLDVFTGSDDHTLTKTSLNKNRLVYSRAPPQF